jgi:hypothetical protein
MGDRLVEAEQLDYILERILIRPFLGANSYSRLSHGVSMGRPISF